MMKDVLLDKVIRTFGCESDKTMRFVKAYQSDATDAMLEELYDELLKPEEE